MNSSNRNSLNRKEMAGLVRKDSPTQEEKVFLGSVKP